MTDNFTDKNELIASSMNGGRKRTAQRLSNDRVVHAALLWYPFGYVRGRHLFFCVHSSILFIDQTVLVMSEANTAFCVHGFFFFFFFVSIKPSYFY